MSLSSVKLIGSDRIGPCLLAILASVLCMESALQAKTVERDAVTLRDRQYEVNDPCDIKYEAPEGYAITGLGMRAVDAQITTLWVEIQPVNADGTLGVREIIRQGTTPDRYPEGMVNLPVGYVAVGWGVNVIEFWDIGALTLWGAPLNRDGSLGPIREFRSGFQAHTATEKQVLVPEKRVLTGVGIAIKDHNAVGIMAQSAFCAPKSESEFAGAGTGVQLQGRKLECSERTVVQSFAPPGHAITGVMMRAADAEISTVWSTVCKINADGTLGDPIKAVEGWYPTHEGEAEVNLPEGYVAVGIGLSISLVSDIGDLCLWGAPLKPDGTLGEVKEFRSGKQSKPGEPFQRSIQATPGNLLTAYGFRINEGEVLGMMAISSKLIVKQAGK